MGAQGEEEERSGCAAKNLGALTAHYVRDIKEVMTLAEILQKKSKGGFPNGSGCPQRILAKRWIMAEQIELDSRKTLASSMALANAWLRRTWVLHVTTMVLW